MPHGELFGETRTIPADGATNWGADVRGILEDLIEAVDKMSTLVSDVPYLVLQGTAYTFTGDAPYTCPVSSNRMTLTAGSAITLGAGATDAIASVTKDGQTLLLVGTSDSNTIRLDSDHQNVIMNGDAVLGLNDAIWFMWTGTDWIEISRSN